MRASGQEYQTLSNNRNRKSITTNRGLSEYGGGSRGGQLAPPSIEDYKVRIDNEIRSSIETVKAAPSLSHIAKSKRYVNNSYYKQV